MRPLITLVLIAALLAGCVPVPQEPAVQPGAPAPMDRSVAGLPSASPPAEVRVPDGGSFALDARPVAKSIGGNPIRMFGYNGQIPGPIIRVRQNDTIYVNFTNRIDMETTVHSHGLRLENRFDGVPNLTQPPVQPGESFLYKLDFPDWGVYWYHPHVREDYQQELGLYGAFIVEPLDGSSLGEADREEVIFLDDIYLLGADVFPFSEDVITHALMGRFGNVMLLNGNEHYSLSARKGELIRLYLINSANTRTFNFTIPGVPLKLVGGDSERYERERIVGGITLAPSERAIVELFAQDAGTFKIVNDNPDAKRDLGTFVIEESAVASRFGGFFGRLRTADIGAGREDGREPDFELDLSVDTRGMNHRGMMADHSHEGIEWEDGMAMMNRMMHSGTLDWKLIDRRSGKENMDIAWQFEQGSLVKIRIRNLNDSMHPMQHPIHFHGNRFLVLSTNGVPSDTLVWKDTVLVPMGATVDILLEASNPGEWMMHCHIAEHLQDGMMGHYHVG